MSPAYIKLHQNLIKIPLTYSWIFRFSEEILFSLEQEHAHTQNLTAHNRIQAENNEERGRTQSEGKN